MSNKIKFEKEAQMELILRSDFWVFQKDWPENFGTENYWTLVYDEGLYIKYNDLSLFSFFKYIPY